MLTISARPAGVEAASQRLIQRANAIRIADADREGGKRYVVHAYEKLTAFLELEEAIYTSGELVHAQPGLKRMW